MVWSPMSNLLLYGGTADIAAALAAGVRIGIGSDWSPSGSKNLLGELKVAWLLLSRSVDWPSTISSLWRPAPGQGFSAGGRPSVRWSPENGPTSSS